MIYITRLKVEKDLSQVDVVTGNIARISQIADREDMFYVTNIC